MVFTATVKRSKIVKAERPKVDSRKTLAQINPNPNTKL